MASPNADQFALLAAMQHLNTLALIISEMELHQRPTVLKQSSRHIMACQMFLANQRGRLTAQDISIETTNPPKEVIDKITEEYRHP